MIDLKSMTYDTLAQFMAELSQPSFRTAQVFDWMHKKHVRSFADMKNLPATLRDTLSQQCFLGGVTVQKELCSAQDDTRKYLLSLADDHCVEAVLMNYRHGSSLCISTQVGCRQGCGFCASTIGGLQRNLTASEMLDQIYIASSHSGKPIGSVVLMGIGEPLDNYDNVLSFLRILSDPRGLGLSLRHVSLSTCGLVEEIDRLAEEKLGLTLSVSLHATDDKTRSEIMPINRRYNLAGLLQSCRRYFDKTGRRVSFEYALIDGVNDSRQQAKQLAQLLRGMNCHVNLIPVNAVKERQSRRSTPRVVEEFRRELCSLGINATVRRELGSDISAACGQLRREHTNDGQLAPQTDVLNGGGEHA